MGRNRETGAVRQTAVHQGEGGTGPSRRSSSGLHGGLGILPAPVGPGSRHLPSVLALQAPLSHLAAHRDPVNGINKQLLEHLQTSSSTAIRINMINTERNQLR